MKELSIEEKAKRYDEAKYIMEEYLKSGNAGVIAENTIKHAFPELKESEDERIRKWIINEIKIKHHNLDEDNVDFVDKAIAWLEKQGEPTEINSSEFDSQLNRLLKQFESLPKEDLTSSLSFYLNVVQNDGTYKEEKQGEQKYIPKYKIGDYVKNTNYKGEPIYEIVYMDKECYICEYRGKERMGDKAVMHFSFNNPYLRLVQKPADKVEPKFKVGDWVVYTGYLLKDSGKEIYVMQVASVEDDRYNFTDTSTLCFDSEKDMRSWTIQDAKDGDVLFTSSTASHETFIFKSIDKNGNAECYFAYDSEDGFREGKYHFIGSAINCKPATKEQYDTLMKVMTDRGYTFDFEKKELKKIEQNLTWSEEDEESILEICNYLDRLVREDENNQSTRLTVQELKDWLKSLKGRYTWKPSDEQIEILDMVLTNESMDDNIARILQELKEQLKKLKE